MLEQLHSLVHGLGTPSTWVLQSFHLESNAAAVQAGGAIYFLTATLALALVSAILWRTGKQLFFLALSLVLIGFSVIGTDLTTHYSQVWLYAIIIATFELDLTWRVFNRFIRDHTNRLISIFWLIGALVIAIATPSLLFAQQKSSEDHAQTTLQAQLATVHHAIATAEATSITGVTATATNTTFINQVIAAPGATRASLLQQQAQTQHLNYLYILNASGAVIAGSSSRDETGTVLTAEIPWLQQLQTTDNTVLSGSGIDQNGQLLSAALKTQASSIGTISIVEGLSLSNTFLTINRTVAGVALATHEHVLSFATASSTETNLLTSDDLQIALQNTSQVEQPLNQTIASTQSYFLSSQSYSALDGRSNIFILAITPTTLLPHWSILSAGLIDLITLAIVGGFAWRLRKGAQK